MVQKLYSIISATPSNVGPLRKQGTMKIGNTNHIAFEIIEDHVSEDLCNLNFYLGGKLISNEDVYIPTYLAMINEFSNQLSNKQFENVKLENSSSLERFNTLIKERDANENQFFKHLLKLDETIDQYTIFVFQNGLETSIVWTCWNEQNCNSDHQLNEIYSVRFLTHELISTINQLTEKIRNPFANET